MTKNEFRTILSIVEKENLYFVENLQSMIVGNLTPKNKYVREALGERMKKEIIENANI